MPRVKIIIFVVAILMLPVLGGCAHNADNNLISDEQKAEIAQVQKQVIAPATGLIMEKDAAAMSKALNQRRQIIAQNDLNGADDLIIAEVNGWPITLNEIAYRAGNREYWHNYMKSAVNGQPMQLNKSTAPDHIEDDSAYENVFDTLVDEKIRLSQAQKFNILPSLGAVQKYIKQIEQSITPENDEQFTKAFNDYTEMTGMTEEEYWQIYQVYQTYIMLAVDNLWQAIVQKGESNGAFPKSDRKAKDDYYYAKIQEYKNEADIKVLTDIPELQFQSVIENVTTPHDTNLLK